MFNDIVPLSKRDWKAVTYDYQAIVGATDGRECLVCLTDRQIMWLMANVIYMRWTTRWRNLSVDAQILGDMADDLEDRLMHCLDFSTSQVAYIYSQQVTADLDGMQARYDAGGIPGLNPDSPTDNFDGDASPDREGALCTASTLYVRSYIDDWLARAQGVSGLIVAIQTVTSVLSPAGGVIAGVVLSGLAYVTQVAVDAMSDDAAIDDVICCLRDGLRGKPISDANFAIALDNCNFAVGSNRAIIRDIIASDLSQFANYLSFVDSLGWAYVLAQAGTVLCACPPSPETVTVTFDSLSGAQYVLFFEPGEIIDVIEPLTPQDGFGDPAPSARTASGFSDPTTNAIALRVRIKLPQPRTVTNLQMYFYYINPDRPLLTRSFRLLDADNNVLASTFVTNNATRDAWKLQTTTATANNVTYIECHVAVGIPIGGTLATYSVWIDNISFDLS